MNVLKFLAETSGEILANKGRVTHNGKIIIVARLIDNEWEPTEAGVKLETELNIAKAEKEAAKPKVAPVADKSVTSARKTKV
tara:strand:- start:1824 stop:2069 length:246 start_codon:yes stop_codon:yes gene_type:complete